MKIPAHLLLAGLFAGLSGALSAQDDPQPEALFAEHFDSGATVDDKAPVLIDDLGWNLHHSFKGIYLNGLATGLEPPTDTFLFNTTAELGDPANGDPYGYLGLFIDNRPAYGQGNEEARPDLPGPHPDTAEYYHNRTLAALLWKEAAIGEYDRTRIESFEFVQGNRDGSKHSFMPAVRIGEQWYVYVVDQQTLQDEVRILGRAGQLAFNAEGVFQGDQFIQTPEDPYANHYNAQPYRFAWSESGWTELVFDGAPGTDSTVGMTLGEPLVGDLPAGPFSAVGVYVPENIESPYNFNGHRIDSIRMLAAPPLPGDLFTFTFNNEGSVDGADRPIQAAHWDGIYSAGAQPLVTGEAVFADLSEGVSEDPTPGHYKAGFLFVSGKPDQPAPEGFLVYSTRTGVVDEPQTPLNDSNPQTDWYSDPVNTVTDLAELPLAELRELQMRLKSRQNAAIRYHFAIKAGGEWYVSEQAFDMTGAGSLADWMSVSLDVQTETWLAGVVGENQLNLDFDANPPQPVTIADIGGGVLLETVGIYIDTDAATGLDTWARVDSITLLAGVPAPDGPIITTQPADSGAGIGGSASFTVAVEQPEGVSYQWRKDGEPIDGATEATLELTGITEADAGEYDVVVTGPGGGSTISASAALTVFPPPEVTPTELSASADGGDDMLFLTANAAVAWTATSEVDWITITFGESGNGDDLIGISIAANPAYEPRTGTLLVGGTVVTVNQAARPLPETFEEVVGAGDNGDGTFTSDWFGSYRATGTDWVFHDDLGLIHTAHAALESDVLLYHLPLRTWVWTARGAYPAIYLFIDQSWIEYSGAAGAQFGFDFQQRAWISW
jgi:hypothetical protein